MKNSDARLRFHRLIGSARLPQRADRAAAGTLPTRAYRYCEAVTTAAGYGWWVFPPMDMQLIWDGHDIFWYFDGASDWIPLSPSVQFPDFSRAFDEAAPSSLRGCAPPFLTTSLESGIVQIWTGLMVRTAPEWSVLVRPPANLPASGGYSLYEGIVETDWWFGPLFTNVRLTRTHKPVHLRADFPLLQVQPLPREAYAETDSQRDRHRARHGRHERRGLERVSDDNRDADREPLIVRSVPTQSPPGSAASVNALSAVGQRVAAISATVTVD